MQRIVNGHIVCIDTTNKQYMMKSAHFNNIWWSLFISVDRWKQW